MGTATFGVYEQEPSRAHVSWLVFDALTYCAILYPVSLWGGLVTSRYLNSATLELTDSGLVQERGRDLIELKWEAVNSIVLYRNRLGVLKHIRVAANNGQRVALSGFNDMDHLLDLVKNSCPDSHLREGRFFILLWNCQTLFLMTFGLFGGAALVLFFLKRIGFLLPYPDI